MHPNPRRILPVLIILALAAGGAWWWQTERTVAAEEATTASGTIEAREVNVAPEMPGRVLSVEAEAGDAVVAGQPLITFDEALLRAQRVQAEATHRAAEGQHAAALAALDAAEANLALLDAGPTDGQRSVAESAVARARENLEAAEAAYDALPEGTPAQALQQQVELAQAALDNAEAQRADLEAGARPQQLAAAEAQVAAARAQAEAAQGQVEAAEAALALLDVQLEHLTLAAPIDGIVLRRAIEPGEVAMSGAALLTLADLNALTLTVYVPQDRYGAIKIGDEARVSVDALPDERFTGTVRRIADQAEFTPRNTQTTEGRKIIVFAVELTLDNPQGQLKPGMPADVAFAD